MIFHKIHIYNFFGLHEQFVYEPLDLQINEKLYHIDYIYMAFGLHDKFLGIIHKLRCHKRQVQDFRTPDFGSPEVLKS